MSKVMIPKFIITALAQCLDAGVVPSIRHGQGGNSHTVWIVSFTLQEETGKLHDFEVRVTSSYSQQFLDFLPFSGLGFDGLQDYRSMADCVELAKKNMAKALEK